MAVNPELVERKINLILQDLEELRKLARLDLSQYLADFRNEVLAERFLERIIGRVIDINYHIITEQTLSVPTDYHDSFTRLAKLDILTRENAARYSKLAGLRNRLAHEYNGIDETIIHQAAKQAVEELPEYIEAVKKYSSAQR